MLVLWLLIAALAPACKPKQVAEHTVVDIQRDSTHTEVRQVVRAIPVSVAADSAYIMSLVKCPPVIVERDTYYVMPVAIPETTVVGKSNASVKISLVDGILKSQANCAKKDTIIWAQDQYISHYTKLYNQHKQSLFKTKVERYIPAWVYWLVGLNILLALYYIVKLLRKFKVIPI